MRFTLCMLRLARNSHAVARLFKKFIKNIWKTGPKKGRKNVINGSSYTVVIVMKHVSQHYNSP